MQFDYSTCDLIVALQRKYGAKVFGKIAQYLMAITLHELGWKNIRNHISEDADLDAMTTTNAKYTFEMKTSASHYVHIGVKDIKSIKEREIDGYRGFFLVLRVGKQAEWFAVPYNGENIQAGNIGFVWFRLACDPLLSDSLNSKFPTVLQDHYECIDEQGLPGLRKTMDSMGIEVVE